MPQKSEASNQVIGFQVNHGPEVWDVDAVSRNEPYFPESIAGLTNQEETDWASYAGSVGERTIMYNLKTFIFQYDGAPADISKVARNLNIVKGPESRGDIDDGAYSFDWVAWSNDGSVLYQRVSDPSKTFDMSVAFPDYSLYFEKWKARFSGHFDATGQPTVCSESGFGTITVFKRSLGTMSFSGYSPLLLSSTEFLTSELFVFGDNVIFYTKDITGATEKKNRRGDTLYCRIERDNYGTEYTVCKVSGNISFLEFAFFYSPKSYLVIVDGSGDRTTLESAPWTILVEEVTGGVGGILSVEYTKTVTQIDTTEGASGGASILGVTYTLAIITETVDEGATGNADILSVIYTQTIYDIDVTESTQLEGGASVLSVAYDYDPPIPIDPVDGAHSDSIVFTGGFDNFYYGI